jgi:imidazoleglycerol phosphate dehydratase HisB
VSTTPLEDTATELGDAFESVIHQKKQTDMALLPMDDLLAQVAVDFEEDRIVWEVELKENTRAICLAAPFYHFFKSSSDAQNLNMKVEVTMNTTKIESCQSFRES